MTRIPGSREDTCNYVGVSKDKARNISSAQVTSDPICHAKVFGFQFIENEIME